MDKLPVEFHPEARAEVLAAFDWYFARSRQAAEAFLKSVARAEPAICNAPDTWPEYLYGTRRYLLQRFPFVIVYRVTDSRIEIVAVAHGHRRPGYWADRL